MTTFEQTSPTAEGAVWSDVATGWAEHWAAGSTPAAPLPGLLPGLDFQDRPVRPLRHPAGC